VVTTTLFLLLAQTQDTTYWTGPKPDYWEYLDIWDAEWFGDIFKYGFGGTGGYPLHLPLDQNLNALQNDWAFMPGFPLLAKWLSFGAEFKYIGPVVSLIAGFGLALLIYLIATERFSRSTALWSVALFGLMPPSIIFQAGYADTLGLLFLALALWLIMRERYLWAILPVLALSLTRPGSVALALATAALWAWRWWQARSNARAFDWPTRVRLAVLTVASAGLGWLWAGIAWVVTGVPNAYVDTELSWRASYIGQARLIPFEGWYVSPAYFWGKPQGPIFMLVLIAAAIALLFTKTVRKLGADLWLWVASFYLYLLLVFFPQSSTFRILLMVFPLVIALADRMLRQPKAWRWVAVAALIATQWWWLWECWRYVAPDFSPP
jgi:hypothetical protein